MGEAGLPETLKLKQVPSTLISDRQPSWPQLETPSSQVSNATKVSTLAVSLTLGCDHFLSFPEVFRFFLWFPVLWNSAMMCSEAPPWYSPCHCIGQAWGAFLGAKRPLVLFLGNLPPYILFYFLFSVWDLPNLLSNFPFLFLSHFLFAFKFLLSGK